MSSQLKVIALISGGKDSLFSILHCLANGHEVVALANLYPSDFRGGCEDVDSYMYQTIGHGILPLYEQALGLPLYRQRIRGGALNLEKDYVPEQRNEAAEMDDQDETESLVPLLKTVLERHPDANAVCSGAILSTYQRTRVESVALRLNLCPLAFLWQYPSLPPHTQSSLLQDMASVGQDSKIIKVASGGLDSEFLWQNVSSPTVINRLWNATSRFGFCNGAVLGEGGEFETLAVNGPAPLWKQEIRVEQGKTIVDQGGAAVLRLGESHIVNGPQGNRRNLSNLRMPPLLEDSFKDLSKALERDFGLQCNASPNGADIQKPGPNANGEKVELRESVSVCSDMLMISNFSSPECGNDAASQMAGIMEKVRFVMEDFGISFDSIASTLLLLRSMSDFQIINPIYGASFIKPNPPARVTISCGSQLPRLVKVVLSAKMQLYPKNAFDLPPDVRPPDLRRCLHVQSRSYWAPANIGPYSQAIATSKSKDKDFESMIAPMETIYVAGQIPLVPASMTLVGGSFSMQTALSLQHLWRIGREMGSSVLAVGSSLYLFM